ncbi:MAG: peptidylprolyl isomerase [Desulfatibacillaceae bacterium]
MKTCKPGDTVTVHYSGYLADGRLVESSRENGPLQLEVGSHRMIAGFEQALVGMSPGESKRITIPPEHAHGKWSENLVVDVARDELPAPEEPEVGKRMDIQHPSGRTIPVKVAGVDGDKVVLDANHPLAGQTLVFDVELVDILS